MSGVPKSNYKHIGTEIIVDPVGAGSIIIDPSFVEKFLRTHNKTSMSVHSLVFYRRGLQGVKAATEYTREHAREKLAVHKDGTELENALIMHQIQLAYASGEAAVKYTQEAEEKINSQLAATVDDEPNAKHIREVEETNAMAETVTNMQKTQVEKMYDRSMSLYARVKRWMSSLKGQHNDGAEEDPAAGTRVAMEAANDSHSTYGRKARILEEQQSPMTRRTSSGEAGVMVTDTDSIERDEVDGTMYEPTTESPSTSDVDEESQNVY